MKQNSVRLIVILAAVLLLATVILLTFYRNHVKEYEISESMELYFFPEEYEEENSSISKTITLTQGADYLIELNSICSDGVLEIIVLYNNQQSVYEVSADKPYQGKIEFVDSPNEQITITINIQSNTDGYVKVFLYTR